MAVDAGTLYENTSFWARDYGDYQPNPPFEGNRRVDVAVIGGGYTGLSTARELRESDSAVSVAVLEGGVVGFGASGRNGGFSMKLFGLEPEFTKLRWGRQRTIDAHHFSLRAVALLQELVEKHGLDSDYRHSGMLRVSYTPRQLKRLQRTFELFQELGVTGDMSFYDKNRMAEEFFSERYLGGIHESEAGILNPCKHVRELKRIALAAGVEVFEKSPVTMIRRAGREFELETPRGLLRAGRLALATNAYSRTLRGLPRIRGRQIPVWTFQVVTERLSREIWASLGWEKGQAFEDNRQLIHYFRPTVDGRITMGGSDLLIPSRGGLDHDYAPRIWAKNEAHLKWLFPQLADVRFEYHWGGPVSVNVDMTPEVGFIGDARVIYALGFIGHGLSLSHLVGRLIADLLLERKTELTDFWIVNRRSIPWPPEPISFMAKKMIYRFFRLWDAWEERGIRRGGGRK